MKKCMIPGVGGLRRRRDVSIGVRLKISVRNRTPCSGRGKGMGLQPLLKSYSLIRLRGRNTTSKAARKLCDPCPFPVLMFRYGAAPEFIFRPLFGAGIDDFVFSSKLSRDVMPNHIQRVHVLHHILKL